MDRLKDKVAIITGAAGGIGSAAAVRFASEGAKLALVDLDPKKLEKVAEQVRKGGGEALVVACDVTQAEQITATVEKVVEHYGKLDVLANIAGVLHCESSLETTAEQWNKIISINLTGTFLMCQAALPHLIKTKGAIVNTTSTAAWGAHPWMAAYAASKGALQALTKSLSVEFVKSGVRINAVCPGAIATNMHAAFRMPSGANPELLKGAIPHVPYGSPDKVAGAYAFLASSDAAFMNGSEIRVDGGARS